MFCAKVRQQKICRRQKLRLDSIDNGWDVILNVTRRLELAIFAFPGVASRLEWYTFDHDIKPPRNP